MVDFAKIVRNARAAECANLTLLRAARVPVDDPAYALIVAPISQAVNHFVVMGAPCATLERIVQAIQADLMEAEDTHRMFEEELLAAVCLVTGEQFRQVNHCAMMHMLLGGQLLANALHLGPIQVGMVFQSVIALQMVFATVDPD